MSLSKCHSSDYIVCYSVFIVILLLGQHCFLGFYYCLFLVIPGVQETSANELTIQDNVSQITISNFFSANRGPTFQERYIHITLY